VLPASPSSTQPHPIGLIAARLLASCRRMRPLHSKQPPQMHVERQPHQSPDSIATGPIQPISLSRRQIRASYPSRAIASPSPIAVEWATRLVGWSGLPMPVEIARRNNARSQWFDQEGRNLLKSHSKKAGDQASPGYLQPAVDSSIPIARTARSFSPRLSGMDCFRSNVLHHLWNCTVVSVSNSTNRGEG
jgi:hypothetical protein